MVDERYSNAMACDVNGKEVLLYSTRRTIRNRLHRATIFGVKNVPYKSHESVEARYLFTFTENFHSLVWFFVICVCVLVNVCMFCGSVKSFVVKLMKECAQKSVRAPTLTRNVDKNRGDCDRAMKCANIFGVNGCFKRKLTEIICIEICWKRFAVFNPKERVFSINFQCSFSVFHSSRWAFTRSFIA